MQPWPRSLPCYLRAGTPGTNRTFAPGVTVLTRPCTTRLTTAPRATHHHQASALLWVVGTGVRPPGAPIRDGGIYIPVRGWGGEPAERGIEIKPVNISDVLERTEWLELLRDLVRGATITPRVAGEYAPEQTADAQRALEAGGLRGRPVIFF